MAGFFLRPRPGRRHTPVTVEFAGGMFDVHDRRPIVLTPDSAREWTSPDTSIEAALELLSTIRPETAFQWHPVTRQMSNVKYQAPTTIYQFAPASRIAGDE